MRRWRIHVLHTGTLPDGYFTRRGALRWAERNLHRTDRFTLERA